MSFLKIIHLFHGLIIAPVLIILAFFVKKNFTHTHDDLENDLFPPEKRWLVILFLGVITLILNTFKLAFPSCMNFS